MKLIDKNSIDYLPVHDSDLSSVKIAQHDNGETNLIIDICFCEGEFEELNEECLNLINSDGMASFLFKNCELIDIKMHCNRTQRDAIDYIQIEEDQLKKKNNIKIIFISGSKLECTAEYVALTQYDEKKGLDLGY